MQTFILIILFQKNIICLNLRVNGSAFYTVWFSHLVKVCPMCFQDYIIGIGICFFCYESIFGKLSTFFCNLLCYQLSCMHTDFPNLPLETSSWKSYFFRSIYLYITDESLSCSRFIPNTSQLFQWYTLVSSKTVQQLC